MAKVTKYIERNLTDYQTGDKLVEEVKSYSFKTEKTETWGKMFIQSMSKAIGVSGDENTVLIRLIQEMDRDNMVDLSSRKKQDIIIYNIYAAKNPEIDIEDKDIRAKASRRFSQLVKKLIDRGLVAKKNSSTYMVNDEYIEFTYPDSINKNAKRKNFLMFSASMDSSTGDVRCKITESDTGVNGMLAKNIDE